MKGAATARMSTESQAVVRVDSSKPNTTIIVAAEDPLLRSLLIEKLSTEENFRVSGGVSNSIEVAESVASRKPDILVLDLQWSGSSGFGMIEKIADMPNRPLIIALGSDENPENQLLSARAGAHGFVAKSMGLSALCEAIRTVKSGGVYFGLQVSERVFDEYHKLSRRVKEQEHPAHSLSEREHDVLVCVADGLTNREIADQLFMSIHTVKLHVQRIFRKLNIPNRTEAAVFAVREGLVNSNS